MLLLVLAQRSRPKYDINNQRRADGPTLHSTARPELANFRSEYLDEQFGRTVGGRRVLDKSLGHRDWSGQLNQFSEPVQIANVRLRGRRSTKPTPDCHAPWKVC